jgi:hypothetical protein
LHATDLQREADTRLAVMHGRNGSGPSVKV